MWYLSSSQNRIFGKFVWPTRVVSLDSLFSGDHGGVGNCGEGGNSYNLLCQLWAGRDVGPLAQCLGTAEELKECALSSQVYMDELEAV